MNIRIQTFGVFSFLPFFSCDMLYQCQERIELTCFVPAESASALEALEKGLDTLMDLCDVVTEKFSTARDGFNAEQADRMES